MLGSKVKRMIGIRVPVPSVDDGAIVVAPQACFEVESHENGVVIHLSAEPATELGTARLGRNAGAAPRLLAD